MVVKKEVKVSEIIIESFGVIGYAKLLESFVFQEEQECFLAFIPARARGDGRGIRRSGLFRPLPHSLCSLWLSILYFAGGV